MSFLKPTAEGVRISIHAQPGASSNKIAGRHGDALKVKIKAVPEDGRANEELIAFLAKTLRCAKRDLELVSGATSRSKVVLARGMDEAFLRDRLGAGVRV